MLNDATNPFTFLDYIFVNTNKFKHKIIPAELLAHEAIHVKEKHSLDIIMIELIKVVFWFNPFIYFYKQSIALNHEFIVDEQLIKQAPVHKYQHLLLDVIDNQNHALASNWNFLLTSVCKKTPSFLDLQIKLPKTRLAKLLILRSLN